MEHCFVAFLLYDVSGDVLLAPVRYKRLCFMISNKLFQAFIAYKYLCAEFGYF